MQESDRSELTLSDCWAALERAKGLAWLGLPRFLGGRWGRIDPDEYEHYNNPLNADLHQIVPGKLFAFRAPKHLKGLDYLDDGCGCRHFSPSYYVDLFRQMGISSVVSVDPISYDASEFARQGLHHHELDYGDWAAPSQEAVAGFFRVVDAARGGVAVHSAGGHGRNGTLIALYLMRRHGFRAQEAVAWLRICRPGSVVAEQHAFLCRLEAAAAAQGLPPGRSILKASSASPRDVPVAVLVARRASTSLPSPQTGRVLLRRRPAAGSRRRLVDLL